jgi:hypothetical protein
VFERTTNTEETVYALVMIDLLSLSYAGLAWKTEKEKTTKISSYDATKGQTLQQFLPADIRTELDTAPILSTTPILVQPN